MQLPEWMVPPERSAASPTQIERTPKPKRDYSILSPATKALQVMTFNNVFSRVLEDMYAGSTLASSLRELPIPVDPGAFMRWVRSSPDNLKLYNEAKEVRTEAWAGRLLEHAEGTATGHQMDDTARSRLIVDSYKWLMGADNRKQYGDSKQIEVTSTISITAALDQANARLSLAQSIDSQDIIDVTEVEDRPLLSSPEEENDDEG